MQTHAKRGRPVGTIKFTYQRKLDVWILVEAQIVKMMAAGKIRAVASACDEVFARGALKWVCFVDVTGGVEGVGRRSKARNKPHYNVYNNGSGPQMIRDNDGRFFIEYFVTSSATLRNLYMQADTLAQSDAHILHTWNDLLCDMLGRPRPSRPRIIIARKPFAAIAAERN